jgi:hypothetical protein
MSESNINNERSNEFTMKTDVSADDVKAIELAEKLKEQENEAYRKNNFEEAIIFFTQAISYHKKPNFLYK